MKPSFLNHSNALLTAMIQQPDPESCINLIRNSAAEGADAFGIQFCDIKREYRTEINFKHIFSRCGNKPIYITNYRLKESIGMSDDELADELLLGLKAGATLVDVMGDMYCPETLQITYNQAAVDKQRKLIDKIHQSGGEVLISSHALEVMTPEQILEIAKAQEARGADIAKIVTLSKSKADVISSFEAMELMKKELKIPFLYLSNGTHFRLQRIVGPYFGSCMILAIHEYGTHTSKEQPNIRSARLILDNIDWEDYREE